MTSLIKKIIISAVIIVALVLVYIFFIKKAPDPGNLTSSTSSPTGLAALSPTNTTGAQDATVDTEFLSILLSVKNIKLNDSIFSDKAFINLRDSSIVLTPDGTEGRTNPFAPIGLDTTNTQVNTNLPTQPGTTVGATVDQTGVLKTPKKN